MENEASAAQPSTPAPRKFSPRTLMLIGVLAVVAAILIFFALKMNSNPPQTPGNNQTQTNPTPTVEKTAIVSFFPDTINAATSPSASVDIMVTAGNTPITGAQVEISYDPAIIKNPRILPPEGENSLFGPASAFIELFNEVDPENATITYAIGIQPTGNPVVGSGSIGKLVFSVAKGNTPVTSITFGDKTAVTTQGVEESILNSTTPLTVTLQ